MGRTKGAVEGQAAKLRKAAKKRKAAQTRQAAEKSARARFIDNFSGAPALPSAAAQLAALNQQRDALIAQQAQAQATMEHAQEDQALPLVVDDDGGGKEDKDNSDSPMLNYLSLVNARLMVEMKHGSTCNDTTCDIHQKPLSGKVTSPVLGRKVLESVPIGCAFLWRL